ncbi:efflux transporter outer membrane subunit [Geotalea sp. SG265]|uniref:efflux transporter outer membrane subunit n=1 Tax=Geotalea sp. SG265 TaxID=2922867 RepID=UPI001FB03C58|nr:efflux transporter outer membrane subunit [Geotalea sp. SG265]
MAQTKRTYQLIHFFPLLLLLSACSIGPDYVRPAAPVPTQLKGTKGWKTAQPTAGELNERWWELYHDPQLNALEERVAVDNQNLKIAEAQFRQARALVQVARAGYYPTATLGANVTRTHPSGRLGGVGTTRGSAAGDSTIYSLPMDLSWELDIWGRVRRSVEANSATAQATAADLAGVRLSIQAELAQAYFQLRAVDAQQLLLRTTVDYYAKTLQLTRNRYGAGVIAQSDVLQAENQLAFTQAQLLDLGVQRAQLENAIALLIGAAPSEFSLAPAPLDRLPPDIPLMVPSELLERRPDIAAAERRMAAANAQIGIAEAAWFPTVKLTASSGFESGGIADWLAWPSRFWSIGAGLSEIIFNGFLRSAQTDQARAAYEGTVAGYRQTVLTAFQEVEDNLAALRILADEAKALEVAVRAAQQAVVITTNQYKAGTASYLNVLVSQTAELTSRRNAVEVHGRLMTASILLIRALGGGWQLPEPALAGGTAGTGTAQTLVDRKTD